VVHGRIGVANDGFRLLVILGVRHDAETGRGEDLFAMDAKRLAQSDLKPFGDGAGVSARLDILQQNDEFIASEPCQDVDVAQGFPEATCKGTSKSSRALWPRLSLTSLNRSISKKITAK